MLTTGLKFDIEIEVGVKLVGFSSTAGLERKNNSIERCRHARKADAKRPIQVGSTLNYNYVSPRTLTCFQATSNSHFLSASTPSILHRQLIPLCQMLSRTTCSARAQSLKFGAVLAPFKTKS